MGIFNRLLNSMYTFEIIKGYSGARKVANGAGCVGKERTE